MPRQVTSTVGSSMPEIGFSSCPSLETRGLGKSVEVRLASKLYGNFVALKDVSLVVNPGEFLTLLGPSGSGKTTTMMAIAGFTDLSSGAILIDETRIDHLPPNRRNIGVVFQHLALFPHMSVADNVAFPLRMRGGREEEVRVRVQRVLELVELPTFGERLPSQLSGGQQQRVAFARAVVFDPPVLLLDEPLGALDRKLRESMQAELKRLQRQLGITTIMITHDQEEALKISDRIAVMSSGQLEQIGSPEELYQHPATPFVADFIGDSNHIVGTVSTVAEDTCTIVTAGAIKCTGKKRHWHDANVATLVLRPERVLVGREVGDVANRFNGVIESVTYAGDSIKYVVRISREDTLVASTRNVEHQPRLGVGESTVVGWRADDAIVFTAANTIGNYGN